MRTAIGIVALLFVGLPLIVSAHEGAVGVAKERMEAMEAMQKAMTNIERRIKANRDLAGIGDAAAAIKESGARIPAHFPVGSGNGITDASPEIWVRWDQFQSRALGLVKAADALSHAAISGNPTAVGARYVDVARACTGCHGDFRRKR